MIINKLVMSAFGPYKGKETIYFTQFTNEVFLISGDTGAGKTTIFDAVCYALYGTPSGSVRKDFTLRNQDADKKAESFAEVTFSIGDLEYTVHRDTPEFRKPGESSGGTGTAELSCPEGETRFPRVVKGKTNVNHAIEVITGFDRDSFMRVSVLPQGEFDRFLTANTANRQEILRRIFKTELYDKYASVVKEWNKTLSRKLDSLANDYSTALKPVFQNENQYDLTKSTEMSLELEGLIAAASEQQKKAEGYAEQLTAKLLENSRLKSEALECNKALEAYALAKADKDALDEAQERYAEMQKLLDRQKRAEEARPEISGKDSMSMQLETAKVKAAEGEKHAQQTAAELEKAQQADAEARSLDGELKQLTAELPKLTELLERCQKAQDAENEAARLAGELLKVQNKLTENQAAQQTCSDMLEQLSQQIAECSILAAQKSGAQARLNSAEAAKKRTEQLLSSLNALTRLSAEHTAAQQKCDDAQSALEKALDEDEQLRKRYFAGEAARLAKRLKLGEKCPVCGSDNHPFPAPWREDIPTDAELKQSEERADAARSAKADADNRLSGISGQLNSGREAAAREYTEVIGGDLPCSGSADAVQEKLCQLNGEILTVKQSLTQCDDAEKKLPQLNAAHKAQEERLSELSTQQNELANDISALNSSIAAKKAEAELSRQGLEGRTTELIEQEISAKKDRTAAIEATRKAAAEALRSAEQNAASAAAGKDHLSNAAAAAKKSLQEAEAALAEKLHKCGFGSEQELRASLADKDERDELERSLSDYNDRRTTALATLEERRKNLPEDQSPRIIEQFDKTERSLKEDQSSVSEQIKELTAKITNLTNAKKSVDKISADFSKLFSEQQTLSRLNRIVNGNGDSRVSFEAYIQMRMFKGVLDEANKRLESLSNGRYHFELRTAALNAKSNAGLDINIVDRNSGSKARRDVSTLSGGEKFLASFALAIGLSDYTLRRGAGRSVDMLFIDEGFSTLSKNATEEAMNVIEQLRSQNRTVGIITHVDDIKENFTNMQIQAVKNGDSSTINIICRK